jgi:hypothetical protein
MRKSTGFVWVPAITDLSDHVTYSNSYSIRVGVGPLIFAEAA